MPIDPIERADQPPEIIYLQWTAQELMHAEPVNELDVTWCSDKICAEDTEYVRADVAEQRVVEAEKERKNAMLRIHDQWDAEIQRADHLEQKVTQLRSALAELVRLRDKEMNILPMFRDHSAAECAWIAARKALEPTGEPNEQR